VAKILKFILVHSDLIMTLIMTYPSQNPPPRSTWFVLQWVLIKVFHGRMGKLQLRQCGDMDSTMYKLLYSSLFIIYW